MDMGETNFVLGAQQSSYRKLLEGKVGEGKRIRRERLAALSREREPERPEDLRRPFGQFGPLKDIYLPRDYYTGNSFGSFVNEGFSYAQSLSQHCRLCLLRTELVCYREPRGFGFVQYVDPADATEAKYQMDGQILHGRELTVVFAEENRKKPVDMRARERVR
ncbi:hypothetical protein HHK36_017489 [Tetracentron sinense]|uniref:RRM domain-containing protein n=1 Tax=Tetracentron sinense TaxID=13715 RepID=A0A834Z5F5_TETSI|nr:hypothetical protein HHK36_017489 [Tetracentron sinense]